MHPFTNMHIMKKYILLFLCLIIVSGSFAQMQDFKFKFYGQIRTDFYYNSRANEETVDGLFYMYPKDKVRDPDGNDLNSTPNSNFYTLYSRLGVDVAGPKLGTAKTSAKVEVDFRGTGTSYSVIRLRHAYLNLDWRKSALLLGQNWHPLFGDVSPQILNLSVGAPQPSSVTSMQSTPFFPVICTRIFPSSLSFSPCRTEFSTMGCMISFGITHSSSPSSISTE